MSAEPIVWKREADEIGAMARRVIRNGLGRRAAEGDVIALQELVALQAVLTEAITEAGAAMHDKGYSYTYLAAELGVTRQAARQRFMRVEKCPHGKRGLQACVPCHQASLEADGQLVLA